MIALPHGDADDGELLVADDGSKRLHPSHPLAMVAREAHGRPPIRPMDGVEKSKPSSGTREKTAGLETAMVMPPDHTEDSKSHGDGGAGGGYASYAVGEHKQRWAAGWTNV
jgi:hypothetical protein